MEDRSARKIRGPILIIGTAAERYKQKAMLDTSPFQDETKSMSRCVHTVWRMSSTHLLQDVQVSEERPFRVVHCHSLHTQLETITRGVLTWRQGKESSLAFFLGTTSLASLALMLLLLTATYGIYNEPTLSATSTALGSFKHEAPCIACLQVAGV